MSARFRQTGQPECYPCHIREIVHVLCIRFSLVGGFDRFYVRDGNDLDTPCRHRRRILGIHGEALDRAGIDAGIADHAAEPVDLPCLCLLVDDNRLSRAFPLAGPTGYAPALIDGHMTPGQCGFLRWLGRISDRCGPVQQGRQCCFYHFEKCHTGSPLRAPDTGVDGQYNDRDIGELASLEHFHQRRNVRQGRGPDPGSDEKFRAVPFDIVDEFSPRLF